MLTETTQTSEPARSDRTLQALGWDHPRCMAPMRACATAWQRLGEASVDWDARSLAAFGDEPLEALVRRYDILVIDHPFCGTASTEGLLVPLDQLLAPELLDQLHGSAIGPSQRSYSFAGHDWALAADAACQVSAVRPDGPAAEQPPVTWPQALALVRSLAGRSALPLAPAHALSSLLTLWAGAGLRPLDDGELVDADRGLEQLEWLIEMHALGHPSSTDWEPPEALQALTTGVIDYVPLTYGYVNYSAASRPGPGCRFANIPGVRGSVLGGAGLAISAHSDLPHEAARFAAWVCGETTQRQIVAPTGGQPANVACWHDPALDRAAGGFYGATRESLEAAWTRPRAPWWPSFQLQAGQLLTRGLTDREPASRLLARLLCLHEHTASRGAPEPI
jgi:multiple sugar transport system substrate-binding protein